MILFGLRDIGSVNACLPVVTILKDKGISVSVYAEGPASENLKDKPFYITGYRISDLLDLVNPSLVVATSVRIGGAVPIDLNKEAKQRNLPVVLVEDIWASHSAFTWDILPDGVCVVDEFAKSLILRSWPGYPESRIHVTGMPVFDRYVNVQVKSAKRKLREILELNENWPVVFFPGQIWGMTQAISMLVKALNSFDFPVYLILRNHPGIILSKAPDKYRQIYAGYQRTLRGLQKGAVVDSSQLNSDEVLTGSDIIVGIYSTMTVEACYLRKPVLTIWTLEIGQFLLRLTHNTLAEWPITNLGASLRARNVLEIKSCLRKIITGDTSAMRKAQEKHFKADGLSSSRVAQVILSYYR